MTDQIENTTLNTDDLHDFIIEVVRCTGHQYGRLVIDYHAQHGSITIKFVTESTQDGVKTTTEKRL